LKTHTEYHWFNISKKRDIINITNKVESILNDCGIKEGMILVAAMHVTSAVYVNDSESGIMQDINSWLEKLAPQYDNYKHHETGENNADAYLKSLLLHHEVVIPVTEGRLDLGPWQQIFYADFDGQRKKRVVVKVLGE